MTTPALVLASTSPYRRELLERLGLRFRCIAPDVDETDYKALGLGPEQLAVTLARAKAESVSARVPGAIVVGSDQVCAVDDAILDKPGTVAANVDQLVRLSGRAHRLFTAVCIARSGLRREFVDVTTLWMRPLPRSRLASYVALDRPLDCAGGYKLESGGIALFDRIESADHTAIIGLPLLRLARELDELGLPAF